MKKTSLPSLIKGQPLDILSNNRLIANTTMFFNKEGKTFFQSITVMISLETACMTKNSIYEAILQKIAMRKARRL